MGIRETLNQNPRIVTGVTAAIIVIALVFIFWPSSGGPTGDGSGATGVGHAFYSNDDGQHWFQDDVHKLPPFQKDGKDVYKAAVYRCPDGKQFVARLERYTDDAKKKVEALNAPGNSKNQDPTVMENIEMTGVEVRAPGTPRGSRRATPRPRFSSPQNAPVGAKRNR